MKKNTHFLVKICLFGLLWLSACIQTEIVPETLEPRLSLSPRNLSLSVGQSTVLTATYTDEQNVDRSDLLQWRSHTAAIAEVMSGGVVNAKAPGQTRVVVYVPNKTADSTLITVVADANAVALVEISALQNTLPVGATLQYNATIRNSSSAVLSGKNITWNSSNTNVLSINSNGLATALAPGTAQVTATVDGVNSLPFAMTVTPAGGSMRSGDFRGHASYTVSGTATLQEENNALVLSFSDNFRSSNGPGLGIYLAQNAPAVLTSSNSVRLDRLKSTSGAQTYAVPASVKLNDFDFVVVYCEPFNIPFGFARLN